MTNERNIIKEEVEKILEQCAKSVNLKKYEIFPNLYSKKGDGFLSEFFTGTIVNKENGDKMEIAIKLKLGSDMLKNSEIVFGNEVRFYSVIWPELNKFQSKQNVEEPINNIPQYLAGCGHSGNLFVAMDNLISKGYKLSQKNKYLDNKHLELIFKTYGKFHALSFTFKKKNSENYEELIKDLVNPFRNVTQSDGVAELMKNSYLSAISLFDPISEVDIIGKLNKLVKDQMGFNLGYDGDFSCLVHGDCWSNNMMFNYTDSGEPIDVKLLDFQLIAPGTPVRDLSYVFYSGASKEEMDRLDYYLELYYKSFSEFARELGGVPEELFPFTILQKEWKENGGFGCHMWLIKLMDKNEIVELLESKELSVEQYCALWADRLERIRAGPEYRKRARDICLHAVEYGLV